MSRFTRTKGRSRIRDFVLSALLLGLAASLGAWSVTRAQTPTTPVGVFYIGPEDVIAQAINQAAPYIVRVDQEDLAQVLVINNAPIREGLQRYGRYIQRGGTGLVLFCGSHFPQSREELGALLGVSTFALVRSEAQRALRPGSEDDPLRASIAWASAPPLSARTVISNPNLLRVIVETDKGEPVLQRLRGREDRQVLLVGGWLSDASNRQWQDWPYFRYLVYRLIVEAANAPHILPFAAFPWSPVPKGKIRLGLAVLGSGVILFALGSIFAARRHLYLHLRPPTLLRQPPAKPRRAEADEVGFHRPLAALFPLLTIGGLLLIPLALHEAYIIPRILVPWIQALRDWKGVARYLEIAWVLFDLGTGTAAVRFFARLRPRRPQDAFRYLQFYVWWQFLTGALQFGGMIWLTIVYFPSTGIAHLSYYFLLHALIQFPGFLRVTQLFFQADQSPHCAQTVTLIAVMGPVALQAWAAMLMRRWGAGTPGIGEAVGSLFGLGMGAYLAEWAAFGVGLWLYARRGYAFRALFLPTFDRRVAGRVLSFGARLTIGALAAPVSTFVQTDLLARLPAAYGDVVADLTLAGTFAMGYGVLSAGLYAMLMPAMTAAHARGYTTLLRYYASQGLHYGLWISLFLLATLGAVGEPLILGVLGPAYARAARLILPMLIVNAVRWPGWTADRILEAIGRPALSSWFTLGEHAARIGLMWVLIPRWQLAGLLAAHLLARILKAVSIWILIRHIALRPRLYPWRTAIVPALSAWLLYHLARLAVVTWWQPTWSSSLILFAGVLIAALPLYGFLTALLGGWDAGSVTELRRAVRLSSAGYPTAWLLYHSIRLGASISPLHRRRPTALWTMAEEEARAMALSQVAA